MPVIYPNGVKPPWEGYSLRGVHGPEWEHHIKWFGDWMKRAEHEDRLTSMRVSNLTIRCTSDSVLELFDGVSPFEYLLRWKILPIVRFSGKLNWKIGGWLENVVKRLVAIGKMYGIDRIPMIPYNEPGDDREWVNGTPDDWKERALPNIVNAMWRIYNNGGSPGFPDPLGDYEWWFNQLALADLGLMFTDLEWWYAAHLYAKDRPLDYPEDDVSRYGTLLTMSEHEALLDDFYGPPLNWKNDPPLNLINEDRESWANPDITWRDDHTCFGAWRNIRAAARKYFAGDIAIANTEGGFTPKSPAGDGLIHPIDRRYPPYTPKRVAESSLEIENTWQEHGLWANCQWLYISEEWAGDALVTGAYRDLGEEYWLEMPTVDAFIENAPPTIECPSAEHFIRLADAKLDLALGHL